MKKYEYDIKKEIKNSLNDLKNIKTFKKQIPNLLTASRLFAPLVIVPLAITGNLVGATIAVGITGLTDGLDGFLARKLNATSRLGKDLDAFSDKIFTLGITLPIIIFEPILLINLALEAIISKINVSAKMKGADVKSSILGKTKTLMLSVLLGASYLNLTIPIPNLIIPTLLVTTTLLQTGAIIDYNKTNKKKIELLEPQNEVINEEPKEEFNNNKEKEKNILLDIKKSYEKEEEEKEKVMSMEKKRVS